MGCCIIRLNWRETLSSFNILSTLRRFFSTKRLSNSWRVSSRQSKRIKNPTHHLISSANTSNFINRHHTVTTVNAWNPRVRITVLNATVACYAEKNTLSWSPNVSVRVISNRSFSTCSSQWYIFSLHKK